VSSALLRVVDVMRRYVDLPAGRSGEGGIIADYTVIRLGSDLGHVKLELMGAVSLR
jgi:hypothetical protein